jgi:luciferase family oxidoreductase group 1
MLDLVAVREGGTVADALAIALRTAQHAESLGFASATGWPSTTTWPALPARPRRCWWGTSPGARARIRVGSGGVMLPNHAPLVVAEAFGTLAELYPGRIDLGLGRAPAPTPPPCARCAAAAWRPPTTSRATWPNCSACWAPCAGQRLMAMPGAGTNVPIWLLGSSLFSAQLAAERGLPYAFASHFAPRMLHQAIDLYRSLYRPSAAWPKPYVVIGVPLIAAPTDDEAEFLASSTYQRVLGILTGQPQRLQPPVENFMRACNRKSARPLAIFWPPP